MLVRLNSVEVVTYIQCEVNFRDRRDDKGVEKSAERGTLYSVPFSKYCSSSQIHKNTMDSACGMSEGKGLEIEGFGGATFAK